MKHNIYVSCGKEHGMDIIYMIVGKGDDKYVNDSLSIAELLSLDVNNYNKRLTDNVIKRVYDGFKLDKEALKKNDLIFLVDDLSDKTYDTTVNLFKKEFAAELVALEILA